MVGCDAPIGGAVETLWGSNAVWVRVIVFVSSFSSQQDSEWTGRQLIIHHNYKTPIKPDIDCAIDPDQRVRRKEGKQEPRIILKQFIRFFILFAFIFHPLHHSLLELQPKKSQHEPREALSH